MLFLDCIFLQTGPRSGDDLIGGRRDELLVGLFGSGIGFVVECVNALKVMKAVANTLLWLCARNKPELEARFI